MKRLLLAIALILLTIPTLSMAKDRVLNVNTGNNALDNLLLIINNKYTLTKDSIVDKLSAQVYIKGSSKSISRGKVAKYFTNLLPFEAHEDRTTYLEGLCQISYQNPCQLQFTPIAYRSNTRIGKRILNESYQALLPMYSFTRMNDRGSNKSYVLPFSDDGLTKYTFDSRIDTTILDNQQYRIINFSPKRKHHTLGSGFLLVDPDNNVRGMMFSGRVDFGMVDFYVTFEFDKKINKFVAKQNHVSISYKYGGSSGVNEFDCFIDFKALDIKNRSTKRTDNLDLTDIYDQTNAKVSLDTIRPYQLTLHEDSLLTQIPTTSRLHRKNIYMQLPERLVGSSRINAFGNDLKIYGPLDPASFSYDKINGFTIRERLRFSRQYSNGRSILLKPDFGYSFKMEEFRYKITGEWIYNPHRRAGFRITASNNSSEFSSKFKDNVNEVLADTSTLTFKDLGIDYYRRHEAKIEHGIELSNGLMFYTGVSYNYRDPVRHGSRAMSQDKIEALVKSHYADFTPYARLTWTPRQYYYYQDKQKLYIASYYPTFSLEYAKGIKHALGATSDYGRLEFDVQHSIKLDNVRSLSYHVGAGSFFRQKGEYFINYSFFSRSMFPTTWDDHIGGTFNLLDDYWYNSSPGYLQSHLMFESPFMILHKARAISKYVIKERVYFSHLWADGKNVYSEFGYGIGNNYFNLGLFGSMIGFKFNEIGVKASIEIDSHW